jgi:glucuronate isomerase
MDTVTKTFLDENFLLHTPLAQKLYHDHVADLPIIDYHCHLTPKDMAENRQFGDLYDIWLAGDHYKWRAMRTHGVAERYCTGDATPYEKFEQYAQTVPYTLRNPLYHWTHMELQRPFGIHELLTPETAGSVWERANGFLQTEAGRVRSILADRKVKIICTTDDPADDLRWHQQMQADDSWAIQVFPTFRPDKSLFLHLGDSYREYLTKLGAAAGEEIDSFDRLIEVLRKRAHFFHSLGCRLSDHGLERMYAADFDLVGVRQSFGRVLAGQSISPQEIEAVQSAILYELGLLYHELDWTMQFHLGAQRNNNRRMYRELGPDTGWDSMGDWRQAEPLARYLDRLDSDAKLTRTILYNLNPNDNAVFATMIGNFNDGTQAGKVQWGSGWWFLDQKDGMTEQMNILSNMGLLAHFVGMLTDSRSFLSYSRHEYFRRLLCQLMAQDVANGELPHDETWLAKVCADICYHNANTYFKFNG